MRPLFRLAPASRRPSLLAAPALAAQKPVHRPKLRDVTDTNDAQAYYDQGIQRFRDDPDFAADAFYWAARINPGSGDALYARRAALLAQKRTLLSAFMTRQPPLAIQECEAWTRSTRTR